MFAFKNAFAVNGDATDLQLFWVSSATRERGAECCVAPKCRIYACRETWSHTWMWKATQREARRCIQGMEYLPWVSERDLPPFWPVKENSLERKLRTLGYPRISPETAGVGRSNLTTTVKYAYPSRRFYLFYPLPPQLPLFEMSRDFRVQFLVSPNRFFYHKIFKIRPYFFAWKLHLLDL